MYFAVLKHTVKRACYLPPLFRAEILRQQSIQHLKHFKTLEPFIQQSTVPDKQTSHSISSHSEVSLTNFVSAKEFYKTRLRLRRISINIASRSNSKRRKFRSRTHRTHISHRPPNRIYCSSNVLKKQHAKVVPSPSFQGEGNRKTPPDSRRGLTSTPIKYRDKSKVLAGDEFG